MLKGQVLEAIKKIDTPNIEEVKPNIYLIRNENEEVTGYRVNNQSYFFKRFKSFNGRLYLLNSVTNEIKTLNKLEWNLLDKLPVYTEGEDYQDLCYFGEKDEIDKAIKGLWDFLKGINGKGFILPKLQKRDELLDNFVVRTLLINTTEQCNLRCTYCYFNGHYDQTRVHNTSFTKFNDIKGLIDRFLNYQKESNNPQRAIYFFGGEPLINFNLIREVVLYVKDVARQKNIDISNIIFQIATNGTLLTKDKMDFLAEHKINVNVSMDGPNHDLYRVDLGGKGTLDRVTKKLEELYESYPEYYRNYVAITTVITPPFDIERLYNFYLNWKPANEALTLDLDLILFNYDSYSPKEMNELFEMKKQLWNLFVDTHRLSNEEKRNSWIYFFTTGFNFLHMAFSRVLWRIKDFNKSGTIENLNGVRSLPGLYITTVGTNKKLYGSYEYQSEIFEIGDIENGFNKESVYNIAENFHQANSCGSCTTCWAARLCKMDYPDFYISDKDDMTIVKKKLKAKKVRCQIERKDLELALSAVKSIEENYGEQAFDYMDEEKQKQLAEQNREPWLPFNSTIKVMS